MEAELAALEDKVVQLVRLASSLRNENRNLRQQVLSLREDNARLAEKVEGSKHRVAAILAKLPEQGDE
ncbi:hypothetical protein [Chitinilyticum piscinae]|uniref:TIGR02449 family protein n=1 Tax=Chitinilyticum piscinae TaxID=2866724 RepID=A0A8J7FF02_9NEIS|nr:hypothetical protein [Chitinilyticum piscinae]MBE9608193.1 hypothetical protein [Chitinilyticum piscinae]